MIMKKIISVLCIAALLISSLPAYLTFASEEPDYTVSKLYINDYFVWDIPHEFIIIDGVSMVAVSDIAIPMLVTPKYNADKTSARVIKEAKNADITFTSGKDTAVLNGTNIPLRKAPFLKDGDLYIPLKEFCDAMSYIVEYNGDENAVYIYTYTKELIKAMARFNERSDSPEMMKWLLNQFEPETGGFYYTLSSKEYPQYSTHIESSGQGYSLLSSGKIGGFYNHNNLQSILPENVKKTLGEYIRSCQSDVDGYFYDKWCMTEANTSSVKKSRDLGNATAMLGYAEADPAYLLPTERISAEAAESASASGASTLERYTSEEAFISYLNSLNWSDSYNTGNNVTSQWRMIKAAGLTKVCTDFISAKQNPETGMWEDGYTYHAGDGVMKIGSLYNSLGVKIPHPDKIIASMLKILQSDEVPATACEVWNLLEAMNYVLSSHKWQIDAQTKASIDAALLDIMDITYEDMKIFEKYDGGYSYWPETTQTQINGAPAALGRAESEMDATRILGVAVRASLYSIMGSSIIPPLFDDQREEIVSYLANAPKTQKLDIPTGCSYDFEDAEIGGMLPSGIGKSVQSGSVSVAKDPTNPENQAIKYETKPNSVDYFTVAPYFNGKIKDVTLECDVMVTNMPAGSNFYNGIEQTSGVQWCLSSSDGKTFALSMRPNESGVGAILKSGLEFGKWHRVKIRYQPDGIKNTVVTMYCGGQIIARTSSYFNANVATALPATEIRLLRFNGFKAATGTIYYDNIVMYENQ